MTIEDNKSLSRRALELWATGNEGVFEEIFTDNYVNHQEPYVEGDTTDMGLSVYKALVGEYQQAFGQSSVRILMQIAEGDLVSTRWEFTATQTGVYVGHPPTNRTATWTGIQIDRHAGGRIVESWVDWDKYRMFEELGFV